MQFTIIINQKSIIENKIPIDDRDSIVMQWMMNYSHFPGVRKIFEGDKIYYWFSYKKALEELPIVPIKTKNGMYRRFLNLIEAGLIIPHENNQKQGMSFYCFTEKTSLVFYGSKPTYAQNSIGYAQNSEGGTHENVEGYAQNSIPPTHENEDYYNTIDYNTIYSTNNNIKGDTDFENKKEEIQKSNQTQKPDSPEQLQLTLEAETIKEKKVAPKKEKEDRFNEFWDLYDKKVGHLKKIKSAFNNLKKSEIDLIFEHIPKYKKSEPNKKFRKNPYTYLNQEGWTDEIIESNHKTNTKEEKKYEPHKSYANAGW